MRSGEKIVRANGADLCVQTFGDSADPAILLIHGAATSMLGWEDEFCERLAAGSRFVIHYDNRDTGRSVSYEPGALPYTLRDLAADAVGLLDAFGLGSSNLVGRSMGGGIRQLVALDHPDRTVNIASAMTNRFVIDVGDPQRERLGEIGAPMLVVHGAEDPVFPHGHAPALAGAIPGARPLTLEQTGHELTRTVWGVVIPAILQHTSVAPGTDHDPKEVPMQAPD